MEDANSNLYSAQVNINFLERILGFKWRNIVHPFKKKKSSYARHLFFSNRALLLIISYTKDVYDFLDECETKQRV